MTDRQRYTSDDEEYYGTRRSSDSRRDDSRRTSRSGGRVTVSNSLPDTNPTTHGRQRPERRSGTRQDRPRDASSSRQERQGGSSQTRQTMTPRERAQQRDEGSSQRRRSSSSSSSASRAQTRSSSSTRSRSSETRSQRSSSQRSSDQRTTTTTQRTPRARRQQQPVYQTLYQPSNAYGGSSRLSRKTIIIAVGAVVVIGLLIFLISRACTSTNTETADTSAQQGALAAADNTEHRVSFVAVGDNLPNDNIGVYADSLAGELDDGKYDYKPIFALIKSIVESADIAYIDQETVIGGDEIGARGWPSFNTTDEMADAVVDAGFDFVATATNHAYDWGPFGATEHSSEIWDSKPVAWTGTAATKEQYERLATLESNGIKFALLNYTYGVNSYEQEDLPEYAVNFIDRDRMASDVERAKEEADVVLVAMHWGTEYSTEVNEEQESLAQFLADMDVDVVLGSHPHVIEPMKWVANSNEDSDHRTLVAYSLGNFICDFDEPSGIHLLEGMLSCDFVKNKGEISIENIVWTPIICHYNEDRSDYAVYTVDDYTSDIAKQNPVFAEEEDPQAWIRDTTKSIVGDEWFETKA